MIEYYIDGKYGKYGKYGKSEIDNNIDNII